MDTRSVTDKPGWPRTNSPPTTTSGEQNRSPVYSSPGVWHRAEGTPKKGGLRWGPRAMWGAFCGDSKGGGCDNSLWTAGW